MTLRWYSVVIDCHDIKAQSRWWAGVLNWKVAYEADGEIVIVPPIAFSEQGQSIPPLERGPGLVFVPVPDG